MFFFSTKINSIHWLSYFSEESVPCVNRFIAQVQLLDLIETKPILSIGYSAMIHIHTAVEQCTVTRILEQINKKNGKPLKKNPSHLPSNSVGTIVIETQRTGNYDLVFFCVCILYLTIRVWWKNSAARKIRRQCSTWSFLSSWWSRFEFSFVK